MFTSNRFHPVLVLGLALVGGTLAAGCSGGGSSAAPAVFVDPLASAVVAIDAVDVVSDGVDTASISIRLVGAEGAPVAGQTVTLSATGQANAWWPTPTIVTDASGRAEARLSSTIAGAKMVRAQVGGSGAPLVLQDAPVVQFVEAEVPRERVSVSSSGAEANDFNGQPAVSGNGRYVAFQSKAFNLVPGDTNQKEDVFVHDLDTGVTERVSLTPTGTQFHDLSGRPSLSDDGQLVAFQGRDTDTDAIYVRLRGLGLTQSISEAAGLDGQCIEPVISGDGRWVAFVRITGESQQVLVVDRTTLAVELVSKSSSGVPGDEPSRAPSISRDGRYVAFSSAADNLVSNDSNEKEDVFVHDRSTGITRRVSLSSGGAQGNDDSGEAAIAADGDFVAFSSKAENLVPSDDNGKVDVFVRDLAAGTTERVSVRPNGGEVDKESWKPRLSADGRYVVFSSLSDDLATGDTNGKEDVFRRDLGTGITIRVSLAQGGGNPDEFSTDAALSADSPVVAFTSKAGNLVSSDENDKEDVFTAPRDGSGP